jgi:HK97 family phage major capsid protein/HK97 family phage prohead protease
LPGFLIPAHKQRVSEPNNKSITATREATFERSAINVEARTAELTFSSEAPYKRKFGLEVLDHAKSSVRMDRINASGALLYRHDLDKVLGVVERAWIGDDKRGHATVRFGRSADAERAMNDAADGVLRNVSVGYILHDEPKAERAADGTQTYRFRDWEPYEISLLTFPADHGVGIGREFVPIDESAAQVEAARAAEAAAAAEAKEKEEKHMSEVNIGSDAAKAERERVSEIHAVERSFGKFLSREQAEKFIGEGVAVGDVRKYVQDAQIADAKKNEVANLNVVGLSDKEKRSYNILAALRHAAGEKINSKDGDFEREVSEAYVQKTGRSQREGSIVIPMDIQMRAGDVDRVRAANGLGPLANRSGIGLSTITGPTGGDTVYTEYYGLIDLLRNQMKGRGLGATILSGLSSNVSFVKQISAAQATWVAENPGADVADSNLTYSTIGLSPKILQATTSFSRNLLLQSSVDVEAMVRNDLTMIMALAMDLAALTGAGANNQPKGILNQTGIGSYVTSGESLSAANGLSNYGYDMVTEMETQVAEANADVLGAAAYLTTPRVRKKLRNTPELNNTIAAAIWEGTELNGTRAEVTNQLPIVESTGGTPYAQHTMIYGIWSQLLIGEWGALEVIADPYRLKKQGMIEITTYDSCDINVRQPAAFCAATDINPRV